MMEQGLASQMGDMPAQQGMGGGDAQAMVQEVVMMLMEGVDPQALLEQGVPMEVIEAAIDIILAQEQQAGTMAQPAQTPEGAGMMGM
jgi:hypothetical protein